MSALRGPAQLADLQGILCLCPTPLHYREQPPLFGSPSRPTRFGRSSACGHRALQTMRRPPRQRGHAQIPTGGADVVRAQQFLQEFPAVLRHSRRCFDSPPTAGGVHSRSPVISRYGGEVTLSRCYTRRTGRDSSNLPGNGKWTSTLSRPHILRYWAGTSDQHRQTNRLYRRMRIGAAQRELSRNNGELYLAPGYACVSRADWLRRYHDTVLPERAHFWYKRGDGLWWIDKLSTSATEDKVYLVRFLYDPRPVKLLFSPERDATQPRREPYEAFGACKFTSPARLLAGSNVT